MNYIRDGQYPITESEIRAAHPQVSFPQINTRVDNNFSGFTAQQRAFLKLLAAGVGAFLRER